MSQATVASLAGIMDPTYPKSLALHSHPPDDTCGKKEETLVKEEEGLSTVDEDRLDALIAELEEEDGKEPDPEVLTIGPGADRPIPAILLETSLTTGLTDVEVTGLRRKYGWNRLNEQKKSNIVKFFKLFVGSVQFVMEVSTLPHTAVAISSAGKANHGVVQIAALLAAGLQDWIDFGVICALLLLNAIVGFAQEYHAGNIVASLKENLALKATVIRNGEMVEIPSQDVVPGDVAHVDDVSFDVHERHREMYTHRNLGHHHSGRWGDCFRGNPFAS